MSLTIVLVIIIVHWFADFVCQTHWQASNKSKNNLALLKHTIMYSLIVMLTMEFSFLNLYGDTYEAFWKTFTFGGVTFFCHTITDYFTSRLNSRLWTKGETHNFFVSVGFDQVLHYIQLFTTYYILTN